jgi:hypothetical protein
MELSRVDMLASGLIIDAVGDGGGGTRDKDGATVVLGSGYVVGGKVPTMVGCTIGDLKDWIEANPSDFYGSWMDSETGKIHYDAVDVIEDRDEAIRLGIKRGEIAIWDAGAGEEIRLADYVDGQEPDPFAGHYDESGY